MSDYCIKGVCPVSALDMSGPSRGWLERLCPNAHAAVVYLFPYYAGDRPGNLSLYARGRDYHAVIREALAPEAEFLLTAHPGSRFAVLADNSPLPETSAAALAGLGVIGENGLLIHPDYGSYVFIGTIVTDALIPAEAHPVQACLRCGKCRQACPAGAIGDSGVDAARCLSALTQRGGAVTPEEAEQLRRHPLIWGCDICQQVCPMNHRKKRSENKHFSDGLVDMLTLEALDGLSRRAFLDKYPERAFTWRGPAPLRRNLELKSAPSSRKSNKP